MECVGFTLGHVASKAVRILTMPVSTIEEKPERKYRSVAPSLAEGGLTVVMEVTNKYNVNNSKNDLVVDAEDWHLMMHVYKKEYETT